MLLVLVFASSSLAATEPRQVLLLHSFDREFAPFDVIEEIFRAELGRQSPEPISFLEFSLQLVRLRVSADEQPLVDYLQSMFAGRHLDLIVPIGGPATVFAQKYRQRLFPTTPMLLTAVDERFVQTASLTPNDTAVPVAFDAPQTIEGILRLLPATESVYVIVGSSWSEQFWIEDLRREFQRFNNRLRFAWLNELSFSELLKQTASLPPHSAIFYVDMALDAKGIPLTDRRTLPELHAVASAPIFGAQSTQLGLGVVGGPVMAIESVARNAATVAVRILAGESPGNIKTATQRPGPPLFDWRELRRWGIPEARLPAGSRILFIEPTLWDRYRGYVMGGAALLAVQTLFIVGLLVERKRRRRAEATLRTSLDRIHEIGGRLLNAQDIERTRIAQELHDDVSQQLAALKWNLQLLTGMANDEEVSVASEAVERIDGVLTSIRDLSHSLYPTRLQIFGLVPALEGLVSELSGHGPRMTFTSERVPEKLPQDVTVTVFRVAQEALQNALKHSRAENVWVKVSGGFNSVALAVVDDGVGFVVDGAWGHGLGLISIGERVESIGGTWKVKSSPLRGTSVQVKIPLSVSSAKAGSEKHSPDWAKNVSSVFLARVLRRRR